jgi:hypothetical protein
MARIFLAIVGAIYILLAVWCMALPEKTAGSVGFTLKPGSGQSEYFTVYGGMQLALGLLFLLPLLRPEFVSTALLVSLVFHGCLVLCRSISIGLFSGIANPTWYFVATEWVLLLATLGFWWKSK